MLHGLESSRYTLVLVDPKRIGNLTPSIELRAFAVARRIVSTTQRVHGSAATKRAVHERGVRRRRASAR